MSSLLLHAVQKSRNPAAETAKKKAELERRLQAVSGKLGTKLKQKKGKLRSCSGIAQIWPCFNPNWSTPIDFLIGAHL